MGLLMTVTVQYFLAVFLVTTSIHKINHFNRFKASITAYQLLATSLINPLAVLLVASELIVAIALLVEAVKVQAAVAAALIFGTYLFAMVFNMARGRKEIDCGCALFKKKTPLSHWHLIRNAVLVGFCFLLFLFESEVKLQWLDVIQVATAVFCLVLLYLCVDILLSNRIYFTQEED